MKASGVRTQAELCASIETSQPVISRSIKEGRIPEAWIYKVAYKTGARVEWLKRGEGPERLDEAVAEAAEKYEVLKTPAIERYIKERSQIDDPNEIRIIDRSIDLILLGDAETRALMVQVLERLIQKDATRRKTNRRSARKRGALPPGRRRPTKPPKTRGDLS